MTKLNTMELFSQEQIPVVISAMQKMTNDLKKGKNLDTLKVRAALFIPTIDNVMAAYRKSEEFAALLKVPLPESHRESVKALENIKKFMIDIIVAADSLMQKQSVAN